MADTSDSIPMTLWSGLLPRLICIVFGIAFILLGAVISEFEFQLVRLPEWAAMAFGAAAAGVGLFAPKPYRQKLSLLVISLIVALVVAEIGLRLLTPYPDERRANAYTVRDPKLGYRLDPARPDADASGFRNPNVPKQVDVVALGDSHTYGFNVASNNAWPYQMAQMSGKSVYNFGLSGYGILHYQQLLDSAVAMRPSHLIIGLYLPNDLKDVFNLARRSDYWRQWLKEQGYKFEFPEKNAAAAIHHTSSMKEFLAYRTAVGNLLIALRQRATSAPTNDDIPVDHPKNQTIISYKKMKRKKQDMDLSTADIANGYEVARDFFKKAQKICRDNDIKLCVLFIPSKERVYYSYLLSNNVRLPDIYHRLVENEQKLTDTFKAFFTGSGIVNIEAHPYLVRALRKQSGIYASHRDSHPIAGGYRVYAEAVNDYLQSLEQEVAR